jgi:hypothetical protein
MLIIAMVDGRVIVTFQYSKIELCKIHIIRRRSGRPFRIVPPAISPTYPTSAIENFLNFARRYPATVHQVLINAEKLHRNAMHARAGCDEGALGDRTLVAVANNFLHDMVNGVWEDGTPCHPSGVAKLATRNLGKFVILVIDRATGANVP